MQYDIGAMPIDDVTALLKFYYNYQKSKTEPIQIKEYTQKNNHLDFYLDGRQYTFYSEDALKVLDLMIGREEPRGKLEKIKEKIAHTKEHEKETLNFVTRELNRRLDEFFNDRLNF